MYIYFQNYSIYCKLLAWKRFRRFSIMILLRAESIVTAGACDFKNFFKVILCAGLMKRVQRRKKSDDM